MTLQVMIASWVSDSIAPDHRLVVIEVAQP